jgi:hypothetical protein
MKLPNFNKQQLMLRPFYAGQETEHVVEDRAE